MGKELFTVGGPQVLERLQNKGFECFLDLKFHDIPATVAKAVSAAARLGVWMVNVHASGGVAHDASQSRIGAVFSSTATHCRHRINQHVSRSVQSNGFSWLNR